MRPVMIADIGGTNSRFALVGADGRPETIVTIENDGVAGIEAAIARFIEDIGVTPRAAVLGIAGPIDGDAVAMTNRNWHFRLRDLAARFGFAAVRAINDFEAVAWSLAKLDADDLRGLGPELKPGRGAKVVFGPGTGLGVAALIETAAGPHAIATEGGHVVFGPGASDEEPIFARLRAACAAVSAETVLSGPGLERLHHALHGQTESAETIAQRADADEAPALTTVRMFVHLLGRFAGDLALTFKATGGVYVAGGVARRLGPMLDTAVFRAAFEAHPPYQQLLRSIPTMLITLPEPGLLGCAAYASVMVDDVHAAR